MSSNDPKFNFAHFSKIEHIDTEKQLVYAQVYAPYQLDTHGDMMLPEDLEMLAQRFLQLPNLQRVVDTQHDNLPNGAFPVETYIAKAGDPIFAEGAWVLGVKVPDPELWQKIKSGELNGFSVEMLANFVNAVVNMEVVKDNFGQTEESHGHTHLFFVEIGEDGVIAKGRTSTELGHDHAIDGPNHTSIAGIVPHSHRFHL